MNDQYISKCKIITLRNREYLDCDIAFCNFSHVKPNRWSRIFFKLTRLPGKQSQRLDHTCTDRDDSNKGRFSRCLQTHKSDLHLFIEKYTLEPIYHRVKCNEEPKEHRPTKRSHQDIVWVEEDENDDQVTRATSVLRTTSPGTDAFLEVPATICPSLNLPISSRGARRSTVVKQFLQQQYQPFSIRILSSQFVEHVFGVDSLCRKEFSRKEIKEFEKKFKEVSGDLSVILILGSTR